MSFFTKFTIIHLIKYDSHCKDCISFIKYIRNMMILKGKKTLAPKQFEYWFFTLLRLCYKQALENINGYCGLRKTDKDVNKYSVLKSIALTRGCSS